MKYLKNYKSILEIHDTEREDSINYTTEKLEELKDCIGQDDFGIEGVKYFDKYQGAYGLCRIINKTYKVWLLDDYKFFIEDFIIDNSSENGNKDGFEGDNYNIYDAVNILKMPETEKIDILKSKIDWKIVRDIEYATTEMMDEGFELNSCVAIVRANDEHNYNDFTDKKIIYDINKSEYNINNNSLYKIVDNPEMCKTIYVVKYIKKNNNWDEMNKLADRISKKTNTKYKIDASHSSYTPFIFYSR